jgi:Family of unknown function (DUF6279)
MMITFTAMPRSPAVKRWIIGIAVVMLTACSAARLGYNNGPSLGLWWLDGYLDLDAPQEAQARQALGGWFDWHRRTQLPDYGRWLATWTERAGGEVAGEEVCRWSELARDRLRVAADRAARDGAALLPGIRPAQWQFFERRLAEDLAELREKMTPADPRERQVAALDRAVERAESFYGEVTPAQRELLARRLAAAPMDASAWLDERERRQRAFVQALRQLQAEPDAARRSTELARVVQQFLRTPDGDYGARQARWQAHTCQTTAELHNSASPAQRQHLRERLAAWEEDVRMLAAAVAD